MTEENMPLLIKYLSQKRGWDKEKIEILSFFTWNMSIVLLVTGVGLLIY